MQYHSTRGRATEVDSAQAVLSGIAQDGGLYLPTQIPAFDWQACVAGDTLEMAEKILSAFLPDIPEKDYMYSEIHFQKNDFSFSIRIYFH